MMKKKAVMVVVAAAAADVYYMVTMMTMMMNFAVYSVVANCYCCYFDWVAMMMGWMLRTKQEIISFR